MVSGPCEARLSFSVPGVQAALGSWHHVWGGAQLSSLPWISSYAKWGKTIEPASLDYLCKLTGKLWRAWHQLSVQQNVLLYVDKFPMTEPSKQAMGTFLQSQVLLHLSYLCRLTAGCWSPVPNTGILWPCTCVSCWLVGLLMKLGSHWGLSGAGFTSSLPAHSLAPTRPSEGTCGNKCFYFPEFLICWDLEMV